MRDETDLNGLKLTIDLKRGVDAGQADGQAVQDHPAGGQLQPANFNVLVAGQPKVMGVREISGRVDGLPDGMRPPAHLLRPSRQEKATSCTCSRVWQRILLDIDKAIHIIRDHRGGDRGRAQPDDRLRHRRGAGRLCGRDQAAPPEPGVHPQAHRRDRAAGKGHRRPERHSGKARPHPEDHHQRADGCCQKVRPAPPQRDPVRPAGGGERHRGRGHPGLSGHRLLHPRGLSEKDPAPEPAHRRCPQAQGGRRDRPAGGDPQQRGGALLHRPAAGVQGAPERAGRRKSGADGNFYSGPSGHGRGRKHSGHGHHERLFRLHALLLCERQVRQDPAEFLRHQAEPPQAAQGLQRQGNAGEDGLPARRDGACHPHQRGPDAAGGHSADQRQGHPRQSGRGGRHPEEEPAHRVGRPGGDAGTGQPPPLPRPQPARHRCPHPRRGRRRAADASVKETMLCKIST